MRDGQMIYSQKGKAPAAKNAQQESQARNKRHEQHGKMNTQNVQSSHPNRAFSGGK